MVAEQTVHNALESIPRRFRGPGGAVAVVGDGQLLGQCVWGYANIDLKIPMTIQTRLPICSITKQMLCALVIDLERRPTSTIIANGGDVRKQLSTKLTEVLGSEKTQKYGLTIDHLCDNHSGLRDYWALTTLWGARPDGRFSVTQDGKLMRERLGSFHFQPGTEYSYANTNFHLIARFIEDVSGESIASLLSERIFAPAGMTTAYLCPDTAQHPPPCVGYEGNEQSGYLPALNRMEWSGDAGVVASLADMIAYEGYLDRCLSDPQSWYRAVLEPSSYTDGTRGQYHYGLGHADVGGVATIGHGGALRGFRLHRLHVPSERLSIVVMLNHEGFAGGVAEDILQKILNMQKPQSINLEPSVAWHGTFLDKGTQLIVTVSSNKDRGELLISYAGYPETIRLTDSSHGVSRDMIASISGDKLRIQRLKDNRVIEAFRLTSGEYNIENSSFHSTYHCAEVDSIFHCCDEGGLLYGSFDGFLGKGPAHLMRYLGSDVWALACPRGLDAPAPGDWTIVFHRDAYGAVTGATVGCWLARRLEFVKTAEEPAVRG
ncbi:beta-lactamase/transpeptidase-like protein [Xylogone sp. PMI_703]|nr:beta-lactamase/transpeptidase-like protein [Xylogone sp. PMI_703]